MKLTSDLFADFLKCSTKCYLHSTGKAGTGHAYADWLREQNVAYRNDTAQTLMAALPEGERALTAPGAENLRTATWRLAVDLHVETETMASRLHAIERVPPQGRGRPAQFVPVRFTFFNKLTNDERLLLAFDALVLSEMVGRDVSMGKIIHGDDHATLRVKTPGLLSEARKLAGKITELLASASPPDLILNRHCGECEFRDGCRQKALEKDDLSLLGGMSAKERQKLHSKGIFTVTQLSYTFRPRRRPKRLRDKREKYHHSLKALAIREKKIHIVGSPELKIEGTPVYLDVEGLPDRDFYYLIGVRIASGEFSVQHSLWADTAEDEGKIWWEFLSILETVEKPVLVHYGSYETEFLTSDFASLLKPIVATIDGKGLKRRFLGKHQPAVKRFYRKLAKLKCASEVASKCKQRFEKNRDKLFTFLSHDGIPWNNNNAEHAVKVFAQLRDIVRGSFTEDSVRGYLILLSVCQTCKYTGVDFLDFLRSGEKDVHAFAESRGRHRRRSPSKDPGVLATQVDFPSATLNP